MSENETNKNYQIEIIPDKSNLTKLDGMKKIHKK